VHKPDYTKFIAQPVDQGFHGLMVDIVQFECQCGDESCFWDVQCRPGPRSLDGVPQ